MHNGPISQDWEPVVFKKNIKPAGATANNFRPPGSKKMDELNSDDIPKITYVTREEAQTIIEARMAKKLTQDGLAKLCNINVSIIKDFETQKMPSNKQLYSRLLKVLGIKIEKK